MRLPCPTPIRAAALRRTVAVTAMIGLTGSAISGCSSPSRGPETDVVEVERIEALPTAPRSAADPGPAGVTDESPAAADGVTPPPPAAAPASPSTPSQTSTPIRP